MTADHQYRARARQLTTPGDGHRSTLRMVLGGRSARCRAARYRWPT